MTPKGTKSFVDFVNKRSKMNISLHFASDDINTKKPLLKAPINRELLKT